MFCKEFNMSYNQVLNEIPYNSLLLMYYSHLESIKTSNKELTEPKKSVKKNRIKHKTHSNGLPKHITF